MFIVDDDKQVIVGDDKQVSPMAALIEDAKVERLARGFLKDQSFKTLLLPGASLIAQVIPDTCRRLHESTSAETAVTNQPTKYARALSP